MEKLNLNACGVSEMNASDMKAVEGGSIFLVAFAVGFVVACVCTLLSKKDPDCKEETGC